ncbi:MAG: 1-acyl-sn-glycerol-3-phosphate acyltransferase [Parashewanella sp.]
MITQVAKWVFSISGWSFKGNTTLPNKCILIAAPHTSNWDFVIGIIARFAIGYRINFIGKHQLFHPLWGWFFRSLGGAPVDRRKNNNLVDATVHLFNTEPNFKLVLAPEGTRSEVTRWKTGCYHIAHQANIPIIRVGFDFANKQIVLAEPFTATGDIEQDMPLLLEFYRQINGKYPKEIPN